MLRTRPYRPSILILASLALILSACSAGPDTGQPENGSTRPDPVLLIAIDGFRHDYIEQFDSPAMDRMIREGFRADSLHHVFPTKTFATHYTMVTGRHPGTHGVVANNMWDPRREARFSLGDREAVSDGFWYQGGEPIWVTAEQQGLTAATFFYPGTEAVIQRTRPSEYRAYDGRVPHAERIDQVLEWLARPEAERPDFLTLYFSRVDSRGHGAGPAAPATLEAAAEIDADLGRLFDTLESRGQLDDVNILVVSDHGMTEISPERYFPLDEYIDLSRVRVSDWGPAAQIWAEDMPIEEIVEALQGIDHVTPWTQETIPARYHFGTHPRVPDVVVEGDLGWMISSRPYMANPNPPKGMHGWDPAYHDMHGILLAMGPAFAAGTRSPAVRSVDLYPLMAELLNLEPAEHEGRLDTFRPYLSNREPLVYESLKFECSRAGPIEIRVGPEHLALHVGRYVHVLARETATAWGNTGLHFERSGDTATGSIDGQTLGDCRLL
jgi:predicted AlkP superfamily pyrophosphatase or phosphodiesterase